jgi:SAM-dependent methyltransferase
MALRTLSAMSEPEVATEIVDHYERDYDESKRITTGFGTLELLRTQEIVGRVLPKRPLRILDVGGATGVHARWLAEAGHTVEVVDPMPRHVAASAALAADGLRVTAELGDARALTQADHTYDAVLLLGPLYHLNERDDRVRAWQEALRVAKPGGLVIAAAVSRFASLFHGLATGAMNDARFRAIVERDLRDGNHRNPDRVEHWFTTAYFHHPDELAPEAAEAGAEHIEVFGVEGLAGFLPQLEEQWNDPAGREVILESARAVESEPTVRGASAHLLVVTRKATE